MGFFSWVTSDTGESISNHNSKKGALPVYLLCPDNNHIYEDDYEGYGNFGGRDAYALLAQWNAPEKCSGDDEKDRMVGIDLQFSYPEKIRFPLKFTRESLDYESVEPSKDCPNQGFFYDW